jgi:Tfp pilus assembly protein FimV
MWIKGLINATTGLPLDGSALPASAAPKKPAVPPAGSPPKDQKKSKYQGSPCTFCSSKPDLQKCAPTHSIDTCRIKDNYVPRSGKSSSSPKANVAKELTLADISANVAKLSSNFQKLAKTLAGKKRKLEDGEEET